MVSRISNLKQVWQTVIGLEIHAQINSKTKLFSAARNSFNSTPNSQVAFFDMATPGTLPIMNGRCVELAISAAVALKCQIDQNSEFDRKHYFYSDMPAGYQITQHRRPIGLNGSLTFLWGKDISMKSKENINQSKIRISEMHLEQDSGKSFHNYENNNSLIDLNRAGVGLLEIITDPQFTNPFEVVGFIKELKELLFELDVCNGHMEQGALRVDANVSVKPFDSDQFGIRTEIKNIGNVKGVLKAIEFESQRQIELLELGEKVTNETRFYNPQTETTFSMRDKEVIQDYRYYPEPNLPPLRLQNQCLCHNGVCVHKYVCIECAKKRLQSYLYPYDKRQILTSTYSLSISNANIILNEPDLYSWLLSVSEFVDPDNTANWYRILGHTTVVLFLTELRERSLTVKSCSISPQLFAEYITVTCNNITTKPKILKTLKIMFDCPAKSPMSIIKENKWDRISDSNSIEHIVRDFIMRHPEALNDYKSKPERILAFVKKNIRAENDNLLDHVILDATIIRVLEEQ